MTRETRIGLLVGLLFIIMFGLVLSELAGTSMPAEAEGRDMISSGSIEEVITRYSDLPTPPAPRDAAPRPTLAMTPAPGGRSTPTTMPAAPVPSAPAPAAPPPPSTTTLLAAIGSPGTPVRVVPLPPVPAAPAAPPGGGIVPGAPAAPAAPDRTYTVQAGDTLSRIARKVYGSQFEREYKRILEANRKTLKDESRLSPNQVLVIPPLPTAAPAPSAPAAPGAVPAPSRTIPGVRPTRPPSAVAAADLDSLPRALDSAAGRPVRVTLPGDSAAPGVESGSPAAPLAAATDQPARPARKYVIRQGDTLTKIARETLKSSSSSAIQKLLEANKSKIADPKRIPVGMELEIPQS